jgi:hypothetical protein
LAETFPLRFLLALDGKLLGQVLRIFTDTVASWYRKRHTLRGLPAGETGAVTVIPRANSDLRLSPHFHTLFLDGPCGADRDGKGRMFRTAPAPSQQDIEQLVERTSKRILLDRASWSRHAFQHMPDLLPDVPGYAKRGPQGWDGGYR